jgi:hypothetical protein
MVSRDGADYRAMITIPIAEPVNKIESNWVEQ